MAARRSSSGCGPIPPTAKPNWRWSRRTAVFATSSPAFRARGGRQIIGLLSAERLNIAGEPCALTLIQDISAAKQSESELRLLQERLFAVASAAVAALHAERTRA